MKKLSLLLVISTLSFSAFSKKVCKYSNNGYLTGEAGKIQPNRCRIQTREEGDTYTYKDFSTDCDCHVAIKQEEFLGSDQGPIIQEVINNGCDTKKVKFMNKGKRLISSNEKKHYFNVLTFGKSIGFDKYKKFGTIIDVKYGYIKEKHCD